MFSPIAAARSADVSAVTDVTCYTLKRGPFLKLLGPITKFIERNFIVRTMRKMKIFAHFPLSEMEAAAEICERVDYPPGTLIVKEGDVGNHFYMILKVNYMLIFTYIYMYVFILV